MKARLLLIEDESVILNALRRLLERHQYEVLTAQSIDEAILLGPRSVDLVLADLRLPGAPGTAIVPRVDPLPVVIMTSHASVRSAVEAMQAGAIDYIAKPFDHDELLLVLDRALRQSHLQNRNHALQRELERQTGLDTLVDTRYLQRPTRELVQRLDDERCLLLTGDPGCGRELIARAAHASPAWKNRPLVVVDEQDALETDLQHAHTGLVVIRNPERWDSDRQRRLADILDADAREAARRPVRFLIIIDRAGPALDVRLEACFEGHAIAVPALRDQRDDIPALAERLLARARRRHGRPGLGFDVRARAALQSLDWPGNLFELERRIDCAALCAPDDRIRLTDLVPHDADADGLDLDSYFRYFVRRHEGQLSETELANRLGISRKALWERRQRMQLPREGARRQIVDKFE